MGNSSYSKLNHYGWIPDNPDFRDKYLICSEQNSAFSFSKIKTSNEKELVDLRSHFPKIYNKETLACCGVHAICAIIEYFEYKSYAHNPIKPSKQFMYYNQRLISKKGEYDSGGTIRDCLKIINKFGICSEYECEYNPLYYNFKPSIDCYKMASFYNIISYKRIDSNNFLKLLDNIIDCLNEKIPVICGITLYDSFNNVSTVENGYVKMPQKSESIIGTLTITIIGYIKKNKQFIFRNCFGTEWGDEGYGYIPYQYISNKDLARDFWIIDEYNRPNKFDIFTKFEQLPELENYTNTDNEKESDSSSDSSEKESDCESNSDSSEKDNNSSSSENDNCSEKNNKVQKNICDNADYIENVENSDEYNSDEFDKESDDKQSDDEQSDDTKKTENSDNEHRKIHDIHDFVLEEFENEDNEIENITKTKKSGWLFN